MCMKNIVVIGRGGFAKEVRWLIDRINDAAKEWNFLGFIDRKAGAAGVIGDDRYIMEKREELSVAIAVGNPILRNRIYTKYRKNPHLRFPNLIDPSAKMSGTVYMEEGNIICADNILTVDIRLGKFNIINLGCTVGHDARIGDFNTINPGVNISGNVVLDDFIEVGTGTKVIQGVTIAKGVVAGAGSVLVSHIPAETTVVGVPARVIKYHERDKEHE